MSPAKKDDLGEAFDAATKDTGGDAPETHEGGQLDDPNREAVGVDPIWTPEAEAEPEAESKSAKKSKPDEDDDKES